MAVSPYRSPCGTTWERRSSSEMGKTVSVVIPTYNERENIVPLVKKIATALSGYDFEIVFIDDDSKDGTAEVVAGLAPEYPVRIIVRRNERGLASAVVHGVNNTAGGIPGVMEGG